MQVQLVSINKLKNNTGQIEGLPKNPRLLKDDKFKKLVKSIQDDPEMLELREVIAYDNNGELVVIAGNMRLKACQEVGIKEIPTKILPQSTTIEKLKAYTIKDNVAFGEHNWDDLANNWDAQELTDWGLDIPNFEVNNLEAEEDDFAAPNGGVETDIVLGDLFEIGEHRLLCGDSTDSDQVAKLMNGQKADMVFTDPPYGINVVDKNGKIGQANLAKQGIYKQIIGDNTTETAKEFYQTCQSLEFKNYIIWGGNYFTDFLEPKPCWIIWDKKGDMQSNNFADGEMAWTSFDSPVRIKKHIWRGMIKEGESGKRVHPTQKPINLCAELLQEYTKGENIFDGFGGSGSTMVASHQIKKKCFMIEMSPDYCQTIIDRMRKLDPSLIIKKNGVTL